VARSIQVVNTHTLSKASGKLHSAKGAAVETVGSMTGSAEWQQSGKEERAGGDAEYKAAQAEGYAEGTTDRLRGKKDSLTGSLTGDTAQQEKGEYRWAASPVASDADVLICALQVI